LRALFGGGRLVDKEYAFSGFGPPSLSNSENQQRITVGARGTGTCNAADRGARRAGALLLKLMVLIGAMRGRRWGLPRVALCGAKSGHCF